MGGIGIAEPAVTLQEAQAYLRLEAGQEEALLAGLIRSASGLCEAFLNRVVMARDFTVDVAASSSWTRLPVTPVREISAVETLDAAGIATALSASGFEIDIDASGDGWVRLTSASASGRVRVSGRAGMADAANDVAEPIRQGVLRLAAHLFTARDGEGGEPPAAVTALWRPYRRMRLSCCRPIHANRGRLS
jgi:uncharacterized phiE125 gp8 family phage protein